MEDNRLTIKNLAAEDRPREKLLLKGKMALSDAELIAILIGSGNKKQTAVELSQIILKECGNELNTLARLSIKDLQRFKGIGEAKAITIAAALELGRRRKEREAPKVIKIESATDAYDYLKGDLVDLLHEEFWILFLKRNNELIKKEMLSKGGMAATVVDPKLVFKRALEESASSVILAHNHPSGSLKPSTDDIRLTRKLKQAGQLLDVKVLDHIICTESGFYSFNDEGKM